MWWTVPAPGRGLTSPGAAGAWAAGAWAAGAGAQLLVQWIGRGAKRRRPDGLPALRPRAFALPALGLPALAGVVLLIGILGEGAGHLGHPVVPQPARAEIGLPGPILDLPTDGALDRVWQYFSTDGFYKIPVGESTFDLPALDDLRGGMNGFPDRASVEKLRYYGIRTVVLHTVLPKGLPPEQGWVFPEPDDPAANARKCAAALPPFRRRR